MRNRFHHPALLLAKYVSAGLATFEPAPRPVAHYNPSEALPALALAGCASTCTGDTA